MILPFVECSEDLLLWVWDDETAWLGEDCAITWLDWASSRSWRCCCSSFARLCIVERYDVSMVVEVVAWS